MYEGGRENVVGVLLVKRLLLVTHDNPVPVLVSDLTLQPPM